ncbi:RecQ family ATP-dependent DNA helicase [Leptolyngbya sp. FACHB-8]|uniref:RecQ family ATP-dependent DNA helicase n=1 Tax=unclassified Leptolyngbya TaxID=2650499 RepID=UPI00168A19C3|nr:RecQ family ATP-dependent DNA helicase [Leptolyngbya sp. FACHB-8]MBD1912770.1 ATP-dependent DNA helicase RecQ [Leptolyngbya sp. FACHB-8]
MHSTTQHGWDVVRAEFQRIWGYSDFRPPQGEIVRCLLEGKDSLIILPTGGGKSICFQLPALMQQGLTLVVSPLVALMENQVQELRSRDLPAASLHNEVSAHQRRRTLQNLQRLRLLYLSPETLLSSTVWERLCDPKLKINGLILDEAHCLVQWGDTFRPAYRRLGAVRPALLKHKPPGSQIAIAAFTATADPAAQRIIRDCLQLQNPVQFLNNPYRENLALSVQTVWTPRGRRQTLLNYIREHKDTAGLVYVRTRRDSEELAAWLGEKGFRTTGYHAGLSPQERRQVENAWINDEMLFVICTSAFGMGINKPNVRWVIHYHAPMLLSEYVQEVGRAGRDGKPSKALTLVSERTGWLDPDDKQRQQFFRERERSLLRTAQNLAGQLPKLGEVATVSRQFKDGAIALSLLHSSGQLRWTDPFHYVIQSKANSAVPQTAQPIEAYLYGRGCRWQYLLRAFGFTTEAEGFCCGTCDRCLRR